MEEKRRVDPKDRKSRPRETKLRLLSQAGFRCHYCRKPIEKVEDMSLDHKTPLSRYGEDTEDNLAVSCKRCDFIKGNCTEKEFRARGMGKNRNRPFGTGKGMPKTMRFLRIRIREMRYGSRTRDILTRVLRGEIVDIATYPKYVNPRHRADKLAWKIRKYARDYDFLKMEGTKIWKCR